MLKGRETGIWIYRQETLLTGPPSAVNGQCRICNLQIRKPQMTASWFSDNLLWSGEELISRSQTIKGPVK